MPPQQPSTHGRTARGNVPNRELPVSLVPFLLSSHHLLRKDLQRSSLDGAELDLARPQLLMGDSDQQLAMISKISIKVLMLIRMLLLM